MEKKYKTITTTIEDISPKIAGDFLATSTRNRRIDTDRHPHVTESVAYCDRSKVSRVVQHSMAAFVHCLGWEMDPDVADMFIESLATGDNLQANDPVKQLRDRCLFWKAARTARADRNYVLAHMFKAYAYFAAGMPIGKLYWRLGEAFPAFGMVDAHNRFRANR